MYDVCIVGGGVIGSSIAYFLAAADRVRGGSGRSILVLDKDLSFERASTSLSVGGFRQQFSTAENIEIGKFGVEFFRAAVHLLEVEGEGPHLARVEAGYLFLATEAGMPVLRENHLLQRAHGVEVALLSPAELYGRFPWMNVDDLAAGSLGLSGEGWIDPHSLRQGFRRKAESLGVEYREAKVIDLDLQHGGGRVTAVELQNGERVACGELVNATGVLAAALARMAGVEDLPVHPRKRIVYVIHCRDVLENSPLVIDPTGVYFRPEGHQFLCGVSPPVEQDPDCLDFDVDLEPFDEVVWPALAHRVPAFDAVRRTGVWAGHYAVNVRDHNAILGPHPEVTNLWFANGFSGHGVQQSPAVGRAISELITYGEYRTLDLSRFSFERFAAGELILERNVI